MRTNWLAGAAAVLIGTQAWGAETGAPAAAPGKHIRLLAIGNSFSGNATRYLRGIVDASGNQLTFQHICLPGCSLATHWKNAAVWEQNPQGPKTNVYGFIKAEPWDYVTIQQYSMDSFKTNTYWPYARQLYDWIKHYNPPAEVRHVTVLALNESAGQSGEDPVQYSATSQTSAAALHRVDEGAAGCWHPATGSHVSVVQTLESSHNELFGVPPQWPPLHTSPVVQATPSLQEAVLFV